MRKNNINEPTVYHSKDDTLGEKNRNRKTTVVRIIERKKTTCFDESLFIISYLKPHKSRK